MRKFRSIIIERFELTEFYKYFIYSKRSYIYYLKLVLRVVPFFLLFLVIVFYFNVQVLLLSSFLIILFILNSEWLKNFDNFKINHFYRDLELIKNSYNLLYKPH